MNRKNLFSLLLSLCVFSTANILAAAEVFPAHELLAHWAHELRKPLKWEAGDQYGVVRNEQRTNVSTADEFAHALLQLNRQLERSPGDLRPLVACLFEDTIVIRRAEQTPCK